MSSMVIQNACGTHLLPIYLQVSLESGLDAAFLEQMKVCMCVWVLWRKGDLFSSHMVMGRVGKNPCNRSRAAKSPRGK